MKKNKIFAMMAAAMTFAACSTSDITDDARNNNNDDDNTVTVASVTRDAGGDATDDNSTTTGVAPMEDPFHLTNLTQLAKAGYNYEAIFEYIEDSENNTNKYWNPSGKIMWYGSGENEFRAFTPVPNESNQNCASYDTFYIPDQGNESGNVSENEADWMTASIKAKRDANESKITVDFRHMLSKVTVKVTNSGTLDTKAFTLSEYHTPMIKSLFKYCKATYDDNGGFTLANYPGASGNDRWVKSKWVDAGTDNNGKAIKSISAIVACGDYTAQGFATDSVCRFTIKYDNEDAYEELAPVYIPTGNAHRILEAGKHYTYNVTLNNHNQAIISSVEVTDWEAGDIQDPQQPADYIPYVTFSAESEQVFKMTKKDSDEFPNLEYSVNYGPWENLDANYQVHFGGNNGSLRLRGTGNLNGTAIGFEGYSKISFIYPNVQVKCTGDIRTLLDYRNFQYVETKYAKFCNLFKGCTQLTSAPALPAMELGDRCYSNMFSDCSSLTTAPALPATTLAVSCYDTMFYGCTALKKAPELPATTLANFCYFQMFSSCSALTTAPELPAKNLANSCYWSMFSNCTALKSAPKLPAENLANSCYKLMFYNCSALTTAPELPATTLTEYCYYEMFSDCKKMANVTMLATNVSATDCLSGWLKNAGTYATSRTLKLNDKDAYEKIKSTNLSTGTLPAIWQAGANNTKILDKDGKDITSTITSPTNQ